MKKVEFVEFDMSQMQEELKETAGKTASLRQELKETKEALYNLEEGTEEYNKTLQRAAELSQKMQDTNEFIKASAMDLGDVMQNLTGVAAGVSGAIQAVMGTMELLGIENENAEESMKKLIAVMSLTSSFSAIEGAIDPLKRLITSIKTANITTKLFGDTISKTGKIAVTSIKSVKGALVASGIGAILVGVGVAIQKIIENWDNLTTRFRATRNINPFEGYEIWAEKVFNINKKLYDLFNRGDIGEKEYYEKSIKNLKDNKKRIEKEIRDLEFQKKNKQGYWFSGLLGEASDAKKGEEYLKTLKENVKGITSELENAESELYRVNKEIAKKNKEKAAEEEKLRKTREAAAIAEAERIKKAREAESKKAREAEDKAYKDRIKTLKEQTAQIELNLMNSKDRELIILKTNFDKEKNILDESFKSNLISEEKYQKLSVALIVKYNEDKKGINAKYQKEIDDLNEKQKQDLIQSLSSVYVKRDVDLASEYNKKNAESRKEYDNKGVITGNIEFLNKRLEILTQYRDVLKGLEADTTGVDNEISKSIYDLIEAERELFEYNLSIVDSTSEGFNFAAQNILNTADVMSEAWGVAFNSMNNGIHNVTESLRVNGKGFQSYAAMATAAFQVAGDVLNQLSIEQDENSEKGFETQKKLQISSAVMNMLSGIVTTWATSMQLGPIAGPIAAGVLSAALTALTAVQIAKIKKQKFNSEGGESGGNESVTPSISALQHLQPGINQTSIVQGASEKGQIKDTKVYVLESDITNSQHNVNVVQNESVY